MFLTPSLPDTFAAPHQENYTLRIGFGRISTIISLIFLAGCSDSTEMETTPQLQVSPESLPMNRKEAVDYARMRFEVDHADEDFYTEDLGKSWLVRLLLDATEPLQAGPSFLFEIHINKQTGEVEQIMVGS